MTIRCPHCGRLTATGSPIGSVRLFCRRCKTHFGAVDEDLPRLSCRCGKWLLSGVITGGSVSLECPGCRVIVTFDSSGRQRRVGPKDPPTSADILALIEERWRLLRLDRAVRTSEVAVGLRFDVFNRDGFRCRYCGRSVMDGAIIEADHVIPRSAGGLDTLDNLVTACWDCNRGKSDKLLAS